MYAVIATGGKQYRVTPGDIVRIEKLEAEQGASVDFDNVLLIADGENVKIGVPHVEGGKVSATVKGHVRGDKIEIIKFKRRKHYRRRQGHRQHYTEVEITDISG